MTNVVETLQNAAAGLVVSVIGTYCLSVFASAKLLDEDRGVETTTLEAALMRQQSALAAETQRVSDLTAEVEGLKKPKRTPAEEHQLAVARAGLDSFGEYAAECAIPVLRHLMSHGVLTFGFYDPPLPQRMNAVDVRTTLLALVNLDLVTREQGLKPGTSADSFKIAPGMRAALEELLY